MSHIAFSKEVKNACHLKICYGNFQWACQNRQFWQIIWSSRIIPIGLQGSLLSLLLTNQLELCLWIKLGIVSIRGGIIVVNFYLIICF